MSGGEPLVDACPHCRRGMRPVQPLVTYETADGTAEAVVDCPQCGDVVRPE